jgi:hypothetical protein
MRALDNRIPYCQRQPRNHRRDARVAGPSVLLASAGVTAVFAVVAGVVTAYLVFPDPTMWRIAVNGLVIALASFPIRGMLRRAATQAGHQMVAEPERDA